LDNRYSIPIVTELYQLQEYAKATRPITQTVLGGMFYEKY